MTIYKKIHVLLRNTVSMHDISTILVSNHPISLVASKKNGCVLKYKKAYDPDEIYSDIARAVKEVINDNKDRVNDDFVNNGIVFDLSSIDKKYIKCNFNISFDNDIKYIYVDFEK